MIKPTVGRVVLFHPAAHHRYNYLVKGRQATPFDHVTVPAIIAHVISDTEVNLFVVDSFGKPFSEGTRFVPLVTEPDADTNDRYSKTGWCEWMPYQKGQAAKNDNDIKPLVDTITLLMERVHRLEETVHRTNPASFPPARDVKTGAITEEGAVAMQGAPVVHHHNALAEIGSDSILQTTTGAGMGVPHGLGDGIPGGARFGKGQDELQPDIHGTIHSPPNPVTGEPK